MDMYCPKCDLKIAGEVASKCPLCESSLVPEDETDLTGATFGHKEPLQKVGAGSRDLENSPGTRAEKLEFDPEAMGLTPVSNSEELPRDEDISVLAEMWNNEDIDAELDRILGEAMTPVETSAEGTSEVATAMPSAMPEETVETDVRQDREGEGEAGTGPVPDLEPEMAPETTFVKDEATAGAVEIPVGEAEGEEEAVTRLPEEEPPVIFESVTPPPEERGHGPLIMIVIVLLMIGGAVGGYLYWAGRHHRADSGKTPAAALPTVKVSKQSTPPQTTRPRPETAPAAVTAKSEPAAKKAAARAVRSGAETAVEKTELPVRETPAVTGPVQATPLSKPANKAAPVAAAKVKPPQHAPHQPLPAKVAAPTRKAAPVKKAAKKVVKKALAAAPAVSKPLIVRKSPAPPARSGYVVHAGSFKDAGKARAVAARYHKAGFKKTYTVKVDLKGKGTWYRVLIPAGGSQAEAVKVRLRYNHKFPGEPSRIIKLAK